MVVQPQLFIQFYRTMLLIRRFEEKAVDLKARQIIPGMLHLYVGEGAVATGVCVNLRKEDYITSIHRGTWSLHRQSGGTFPG